MEDCFHVIENTVRIDLKVSHGASRNEFTGVRDKRLCIRIAAAAQDGKANACLCEFLAKKLGCAKREVALVKGEKSRLKTVVVPAAYFEKTIKTEFTKHENMR